MANYKDFNFHPYYDDFDVDKQFYRVLFKPNVALRARELNQMQAIAQSQSDKIGQYLMKDGTMVVPGNVIPTYDVLNVEIDSTSYSDWDALVGKKIVGKYSGFVGKVLLVLDPTTDSGRRLLIQRITSGTQIVADVSPQQGTFTKNATFYSDSSNGSGTVVWNENGNRVIANVQPASNADAALYVTDEETDDFPLGSLVLSDNGARGSILNISSYLGFGSFINGERLFVFTDSVSEVLETSTSFLISGNAESIQNSTIVSIEKGVYYIDKFFVDVQAQTIVIDNSTTDPNCIVGLQVVDEIVSANEDETLLDNSQGFSNYLAPGADRLKKTLILTKIGLEEDPNFPFVELMRFEAGVPISCQLFQ